MSVIDEQLKSLLDLVEAQQARQCGEILAEARRQAERLIREAHGEARARMRRAVLEDRARSDRSIRSAEAHLQTLKRQVQQQQTMALLRAAWGTLTEEMQGRWRDPGSRREWIDHLIEQGWRALPNARWEIAHPPDWPTDERDRLGESVRSRQGETPVWTADPGISGGLRLFAGGACVDGTLRGLLADRKAVEARLLNLMEGDQT